MIEQIDSMLHIEPFRPFAIVLTNGDRYEVRIPGLIVPQRTQIMYCFPKSDRWALLRLNQIAALETLNGDSADGPSSNGSR